jgi:hypothetical protein
MIMQPMLPLGVLKVATWTVLVGAVAVVVEVGALLVAADAEVAGDVVLVAVLVTVTVCVLLEPQPQMPSAHAIAAPMRFTTAEPIRPRPLAARRRVRRGCEALLGGG